MVQDSTLYRHFGDNKITFSPGFMHEKSKIELMPELPIIFGHEFVQVHVLRRIIRSVDFLLDHEMEIFLEKLDNAGRNALCKGDGLIKYRDFILSIEKLPRFSVNTDETM